MTQPTNPLHDTDFMRTLLDIVIPPSPDGVMPGAGSLGLGPAVGSRIEVDAISGPIVTVGLLAVREAAAAKNPRGLEALSEDERLEVVSGALVDHPRLMIALARHLYPAYYQTPEVLVAIGEPARPPFPEGFDIEPTSEALLATLDARRIPNGSEA